MSETKPFTPVKLICGVIASEKSVFTKAKEHLIRLHGPVDLLSPFYDFDFTDYYERQMGGNLKRRFLSFFNLIFPEKLSELKIQTNKLERKMKQELDASRRIVNLDPGYLSSAGLIMATAKDFAHRIPLQNGIYAHLEFLFGKNKVRTLNWTYPDFKTEAYQKFFLEVRSIYLRQLKSDKNELPL